MSVDNFVLIGLHHDMLLQTFVDCAELAGYSAHAATTVPEMLKKLPENRYEAVIMDINLGHPNSEDITPALMIYELLKQKDSDARFIGISSNPGAVKNARLKGIPSSHKSDFDLTDFLRQR